jgi:hypothetical protein
MCKDDANNLSTHLSYTVAWESFSEHWYELTGYFTWSRPSVMLIQGSCSLNLSSWTVIRSSHRYRDTNRLVKTCNQSSPRRIRRNYHLAGLDLPIAIVRNRYCTRKVVQNDSFTMRYCLALGSTNNLAEPTRMSVRTNYSKTRIPVAPCTYGHIVICVDPWVQPCEKGCWGLGFS